MSIEQTSSRAPNFDALAPVYRWMEWASFGPWLQLCRCAFLPSLTKCRRALVLGDGDGRFIRRLLRSNSEIQIDAIDASSAMLDALLRRAGPDAARVQTHRADIRNWRPDLREDNRPRYDLIVSHFVLDCLTTDEIQMLARNLRQAITPGAMWVLSEFAVPKDALGRLFARPLIAALYRAFGLLTGLNRHTLPDHRTALRNSGFVLTREHHRLGGLLVSEIWEITAL